MESKKKDYSILRLDLSHALRGKEFSSFSALRKEANEYIASYRDQWIKVVLKGVGVDTSENLTKRERIEAMEKDNIQIIKDEKGNCDKIYRQGVLLATWDKDFELRFSESGSLVCIINYKLHSKEVTN